MVWCAAGVSQGKGIAHACPLSKRDHDLTIHSQPDVDLSVVICTHNPSKARLYRVLEALANQSLIKSRWELVVVDNCSKPPVSSWLLFDNALGGNSRITAESELGLTPARLAGIKATSGPIIVFVDDDNVLDGDYLSTAVNMFEDEPHVGVAGGIIEGEFETQPHGWAEPYLHLLGVRNFGERPMRALVYNLVGPWEPIGAGMVIRRPVVERYLEIAEDPLRRRLDRVGQGVGSCGDTDMARCATDLGCFMAYEPRLHITHVIPAARLRFGYFLRLCRNLKRSGILLDRMRTGKPAPINSPVRRLIKLVLEGIRRIGPSPRRWLLDMATVVGELEARAHPLEGPSG